MGSSARGVLLLLLLLDTVARLTRTWSCVSKRSGVSASDWTCAPTLLGVSTEDAEHGAGRVCKMLWGMSTRETSR